MAMLAMLGGTVKGHGTRVIDCPPRPTLRPELRRRGQALARGELNELGAIGSKKRVVRHNDGLSAIAAIDYCVSNAMLKAK
jgi:hypothetical protein